jgi:alkyldihydroxyacetonephosphate synthase
MVLNLKEEKWWGWGHSGKHYSLSRRPFFWPHLKERLAFSDTPFFFPPTLESIELPAVHLSEPDLKTLYGILPKERIALSQGERLSHIYGKSYHDLVRIRRRVFSEAPDAVLYPVNEDEIRNILAWASKSHVALVPWGGGTSVTGGVEATREDDHRGLVAMDLRRMDRILAVHKESLVADVEAGILGPKLERELQIDGLTLSHYLESFEFSTVGGWIASRSAGQQSTMYGKIEDMVESVRLLTPTGLLQTPHLPAAANGPDLTRLIVGSEGILGVITQARLRLKPVPQRRFYTGVLFRSFEEGVETVRRILQSGMKPAVLRLSDAEETEFIFALREEKTSIVASALQGVGLRWLEKRGFHPGKRSMLMCGLEGSARSTTTEWKAVRRILRTFSVFHLGRRVGDDWYQHRFENPYLRDLLMDHDILVDTLETAAEWGSIWNLYLAVRRAILKAYDRLRIRGIVTAHLSHMYPTGSSLYFIVLATPHVGKELAEWWLIKKAATDAIVAEGGAVSHHHGIGLDHRSWLVHDVGTEGLRLLRNLKQTIDPEGILNPRKLLPDSDEEDPGSSPVL